jgi:hypothetical protein
MGQMKDNRLRICVGGKESLKLLFIFDSVRKRLRSGADELSVALISLGYDAVCLCRYRRFVGSS